MKRRILSINPECNVTLIHDFVNVDNMDEIFSEMGDVDALLDAIDGAAEKAALIAACVDRQIPVVTVAGAAGKVDPTKVMCDDMTRITGDKLIGACRRNLRKYHGFAQGKSFQETRKGRKCKRWNIPAVFSEEQQKEILNGNDVSSFRRCDGALGTACFVTGTFGFVAASKIVDLLASHDRRIPRRG